MQTGPKGINWIEALIYYCSPQSGHLPSYKEVSERFSIALRTVETRAKKDNWVKARQELGKKQLVALASAREEEVLKADYRHLNLWRDVQNTALKALEIYKINPTKIEDLKRVVEVFKVAIAGERTVLGLPSEVKRAEIFNKLNLETISDEEIEEIDQLLTSNTLERQQFPTLHS